MIEVERLGGVPLGQVAAVHAAVAEGFELPEVLRVEQLPSEIWQGAEPLWKQRLVQDQVTFQQYRALLMAEQDRLGRPVTPLEDDVEVWVQFLAAYGGSAEPFALLESLGLRLNDMARLGRLWARRMREEPPIAKRAAKALGKLEGKDVGVPAVAVGECALSASIHAGGYQKPEEHGEAVDTAREAPPPAFGLAEYAALSAELSLATAAHQRRDVLARFSLDRDQAQAIEAAWQSLLASDRELMRDFRALVSHHRQRAKLSVDVGRRRSPTQPLRQRSWAPAPAPMLPVGPPFVPPVAAPLASRTFIEQTSPMMRAPLFSEPVPFHGAVSRLPPTRPITRVDSVDATGDLIPALLDEPALPFGSIDETAFLSSALVLDEPLPFKAVDDTSVSLATFEPGVTLPFAGSLTSVPIDDGGWSSARALNATLGLDVSLLGDTVLPFEVKDHDDPVTVEEPTARLIRKPASGTSPEPAADAVPPRRQVSELDASTMIGALHVGDLDLDADDEAETMPEEPLPTLTIAQYASLHAELLVHPEWAEAVRQRYHLSDETMQRRLDAAWQRRFAQWPDERADFQHKLAEYQRWLRTQRVRR